MFKHSKDYKASYFKSLDFNKDRDGCAIWLVRVTAIVILAAAIITIILIIT